MLEKTQPVLICGQRPVCVFSQEENEAWWLLECLSHCVCAAERCQPWWHHSHWCPHRKVRVRLLNLRSWPSNVMVQAQKRRKILVMISDTQLLGRSAAQTSRPYWVLFTLEPAQECWLDVWQLIHIISWGKELILTVWCSICCWNKRPKNWDLRKFSFWEKETCKSNGTLSWSQRVTEAPLQYMSLPWNVWTHLC